MCRVGVKKAKAHLELNLEVNRKYYKMGFYRYTGKTRENMCPSLNSVGEPSDKVCEKG